MSVMLSMASIDENGNISGGQAGDQTGKEVKLCNWYSHPWKKIMRPNDSNIGIKISDLAIAGAKNENIGYNQSTRNTLRTQAKLVNYDLSKITTPCATDCSAFASLCCEGAGLNVTYTTLSNGVQNAPTSGTIEHSVSGCTILTDSKYLTSGSYLKKGDILIASGHVAVCVGDGEKSGNYEPTTCEVYNVQKIWDYLLSKIGNEYGVAGLMGNLQSESGLYSDRFQGDIPRSNVSIEYTKKVTNGTISMNDFVHNAPNGGGYGLAQWTYPTRKQALYNLWKRKYNSHSIGCLDLALEYLMIELNNSYPSVLTTLKNATSVKQASDCVLHDFENPADQSESVENARANLGQAIYNSYSNGKKPDNPIEDITPDNPDNPDNPPYNPPSGSGSENSGGTDTDFANFDWSIIGIDIDNLDIDDFVNDWDNPEIYIDWIDWDSITLVGYDEYFNPVYSLYDMISETSFIMAKIDNEQKEVLKKLELEDKINMKFSFNHNKSKIGYNFTGSKLTFTTYLYIIRIVENNGFIRINKNNETTYNFMQPNFIKINPEYMEEKYRKLRAKLDIKIDGLKDYLLSLLKPLFDERLQEIEEEKQNQGGLLT